MKYLAVLGRQPKISLAELESLFDNVRPLAAELAEFEHETNEEVQIARLGGTLKIAQAIDEPMTSFWKKLPDERKIVLGVSDYSRGTNPYLAQKEAMKWKRVIAKNGKNVRVIPNKTATLSSATSLHNKLFTEAHIELIKYGKNYYRVIAVQDIEAYAKRDQARPARDAKVGMLPPKLAQILINLCGRKLAGSRLLDPFCGTGVVLQEAALMGYVPYGTDINERMIEYSERNLEWLAQDGLRKKCLTPARRHPVNFQLDQGDATSFQWQGQIDLVACETYLGQPMSQPPVEIKLKQEKQACGAMILGFLKNLVEQIESDTPVVIAIPAWLRPNGSYERLNILDGIQNLGYNVKSFRNVGQEDLLYHREKQVVAREIIVLRKK